MKKPLLLLSFFALWITTSHALPKEKITFAFLTDTHYGAFESAKTDLELAVADINANPTIDFVIHSGDGTEFGDRNEIAEFKVILDRLTKPYYIVTGNHETNWSENGNTEFNRVFGSSHFNFEFKGYRFVGCGGGPTLRMGPPHIPREEILWLDSVTTNCNPATPLIFIDHFPLNTNLSNWYEVIDRLKRCNIQAALCGHGHVNQLMDAEGIPNIMGRSNLRRKDPVGGFNIVTITNGQLTFTEHNPTQAAKSPWLTVPLKNHSFSSDSTPYGRPNFAINDSFPTVTERWKLHESTDLAAQATLCDTLLVCNNTAGTVKGIDPATGKTLWQFQTGNKIFGTPALSASSVVTASADGFVYCLNPSDGTLGWRYDTGYPIVATPLIHHNSLYIGSSNGKFYAFNLSDGTLEWVCQGLKGYIEARPLVMGDRVFIGTWGAMFYAMNRHNGEKIWEFDTGRGRYFSPGACWATEADGKATVLSSDYFVRAFDPATGQVIWASDQAKGRESMGVSGDGTHLYIKGITNTVSAARVTNGTYQEQWTTTLPHKSDFNPTRIETTSRLVFIPTEFGVVHALNISDGTLVWSHKVSHSSVTSLNPIDDNGLIVTTMDGTICFLNY